MITQGLEINLQKTESDEPTPNSAVRGGEDPDFDHLKMPRYHQIKKSQRTLAGHNRWKSSVQPDF